MDENRQDIDTILVQHNEAFRAFHEASAAFDAAFVGLRTTLDALQAANRAQGEAIETFREANAAAIRLLRREEGP